MRPPTAPPRRLLALAALLLAGACVRERAPVLRVFAASSLTAPFERIAAEFERANPDVIVDLHCAGTPRLTLQLREGAPADVFASADAVQMRRVMEFHAAAGRATPFALNRMAILTTRGNPKQIRGLADLARDDVTVLLCGPNVPAGRYARKCLDAAGVQVTSLSDEPSVRALVSKLELGLADAGVVYASDVHAAADRLHGVQIPEQHNVRATYPIAALRQGEQPELAETFLAFLNSPAARAALHDHGFTTP